MSSSYNARARLWRKPENRFCCHCKCALTWNTATAEHIIPRSQGGGNGDNITLACGPCNNERGSQDFHKFRMWKMRSLTGAQRDGYEHEFDMAIEPAPVVVELLAGIDFLPPEKPKHVPRRGQAWKALQKARKAAKTAKLIFRRNRGMQSASMHAMSPHVFPWAQLTLTPPQPR